MKVSGTFEITMKSIEPYGESKAGITFGRMSIDKVFSGELSAISKGEMLSARTPTPGSAGYVAIELVTGELKGKKGSFALQHFGTMSNGDQNLLLEVVPDSGVGELEGLQGKMEINIEDGQHFYSFEYEL